MRAGSGHRCCPLFFPAATGAQPDACTCVCVCVGGWGLALGPSLSALGLGILRHTWRMGDKTVGSVCPLGHRWLLQDRPGGCLPPTPFPSPQSFWPAGNLEVTEPGMNEMLSTQCSFSGWEATCLLWSGWARFCVLAQ